MTSTSDWSKLIPAVVASGELADDDGAAWDRIHARLMAEQNQFILGPPGTAKADFIRSMMPRRTRVRIWLRAQKPYVLLDEHGAFGCKIAVEYPQFVTNLLLRRRRRRG